MEVLLSILRGINVGGNKKILMADLKKLYEELGFKNITTYIQSGNVVFESSKGEPTEIAKKIEAKIAKQYGFEVPVIVIRSSELEQVITKNPFIKNKAMEPDKLHVTFLNEVPQQELINKISGLDFGADTFKIIEKAVYLHCPQGYGNTKLTNTFFENKLKVPATTRNWKTVNELQKIIASY